MIRILFLIEKLGMGGAEKVLKDLVEHIDQSKFEITVQSVWPYPEGKTFKQGIRYKTVYPLKNKITEMIYRIEAATGLTYLLHIKPLFKKKSYDIECAFHEFGPTKILAASKKNNVARLAWVHTDLCKITSHPDSFARKCGAWYQHYHKIVCVSDTVKESFDTLFHNQYPSFVLHNYVNEQAIMALAEESISVKKNPEKMVLIAVGTLYPPKNYLRLIWAFSRLREERDDLELWILGDGEQRRQLEQQCVDFNIRENVCFWGFRPNPYPFMRLADILVCSSNYEGFSTVITEGLILGKSIVTTECSGMRELLGDSEYGIITENRDDAFYEGLKLMLSDSQLRQQYSAKALCRGKMISGDRLLKKTEMFLEETLLAVKTSKC